MVGYLKTKKGYFNKLKKNGKKKGYHTKNKTRKNKTRKNKTRKNKKMMGGGVIKEIRENDIETEFEQRDAVINYGYGPISTYNLVNCIAIGGVFELSGESGTFLTHESPRDYLEQQRKLEEIKRILDTKRATITKIVIFRIDEQIPATIRIVDLQYKFCQELFRLIPDIMHYSCGTYSGSIETMKCGKAIISPAGHNTLLTPFRDPFREDTLKFSEDEEWQPEGSRGNSFALSELPRETFTVEVLQNERGNKVYKCLICNSISGEAVVKTPTNTSLFAHAYNCPNKNKIPIEPV